MSSGATERGAELRAAADFLKRIGSGPAGLAITGAAGIGKTTVWSVAVARARTQGIRVSSTRAAEAESVLAYAAVADLVDGLSDGVVSAVLEGLPAMQRAAMERVLLSGTAHGPVTDHRAVAAAFVTIVDSAAVERPVLLAIDDAHWLDSSSRAVIGFAARRLKGPVGVLVSERTEGSGPGAPSWLETSWPNGLAVIQLGPLSLGGLQGVVSERLGRTLSRPNLTRIHQLSGGNPFYAIELARAAGIDPNPEGLELPASLAELTRRRTAHVGGAGRDVLLAAACMADPRVDTLAAATSRTVVDVLRSLNMAEAEAIVRVEGNHVRFDHPLLARGVYMQASTAERRRMHRALAAVEAHVEVKARHLALAAATADAETLTILDGAADTALARGAPAAAAEMYELALGLGGDTPLRRIRAAASLLTAGDATRSRAVLEPAIATMKPGGLRATALNLLAGLCVYTNGYAEAIAHLRTALDDAGDNQLLRVQTLLMLSFAQINDGDFAGSMRNAELAIVEADKLDFAPLTSQVLTMWTMVNCISGNGIDEPARQRSLALEDREMAVPIVFRASANDAQLLAWKGDLDGAQARIAEVRARCEELGAESDLLFTAVQGVLIAIWRSDLTAAADLARDAVTRAEQLGGDSAILIATTVDTAVAAYTGHEDGARASWRRALEAAERCGAHRVAEFPTMMLGFLEVSLCRYTEALNVLGAQIASFRTTPVCTEIISATFIPDAVEAFLATGRAEDAEPLIAALEANGAMLQRPWMMAVGARCRAMMLAHAGELDAAESAAHRAMAVHAQLPMPFERARTQLVLGQIQRRRRQRGHAARTFAEALVEFDRIGTKLWAARAGAELDRTRVSSGGALELSPAERRVAERASAGMSNREIAAELFISVKTVESGLSSVYRKLGIRSRAQLCAILTP